MKIPSDTEWKKKRVFIKGGKRIKTGPRVKYLFKKFYHIYKIDNRKIKFI